MQEVCRHAKHSPRRLGSPSSRDRIYLLRNSVQKLKKYHRPRYASDLEFHTPESASITVVSVMVTFKTCSLGMLSLRAKITRSWRCLLNGKRSFVIMDLPARLLLGMAGVESVGLSQARQLFRKKDEESDLLHCKGHDIAQRTKEEEEQSSG